MADLHKAIKAIHNLVVTINGDTQETIVEELVVALYDTEDKLAIENKRKAIKEKYPK